MKLRDYLTTLKNSKILIGSKAGWFYQSVSSVEDFERLTLLSDFLYSHLDDLIELAKTEEQKRFIKPEKKRKDTKEEIIFKFNKKWEKEKSKAVFDVVNNTSFNEREKTEEIRKIKDQFSLIEKAKKLEKEICKNLKERMKEIIHKEPQSPRLIKIKEDFVPILDREVLNVFKGNLPSQYGVTKIVIEGDEMGNLFEFSFDYKRSNFCNPAY